MKPLSDNVNGIKISDISMAYVSPFDISVL